MCMIRKKKNSVGVENLEINIIAPPIKPCQNNMINFYKVLQ